jgi:hypothetical protein
MGHALGCILRHSAIDGKSTRSILERVKVFDPE